MTPFLILYNSKIMGQCGAQKQPFYHPKLKHGTSTTLNNEQFILYTLTSNSSQISKWRQQLQMLGSAGRRWLFLPAHIEDKKEGFWGDGMQTQAYYEWFPETLSNAIVQRGNSVNYYEQVQLWYILYMILEAVSYVQKKGLNFGYMHPNNVVISQDGQVRLINQYSCIKQIEQQKEEVFLAPQQLNQRKQSTNRSIAEAYGVGLTLLSAGILHICSDLYSANSINRKQLSEYLQILGKRYSSYFYSTVHSLVETSPFERSTCTIVKMKLEKYKESIMKKEGFLPEHKNRTKLNYKMSSQ